MQLHHVSLFVRDVERTLPFYRDGLGFEVLIDKEFDGEWPTLFDVASTRLRAVMLGEPNDSGDWDVELVGFADPVPEAPPLVAVAGIVMLSLQVDLDEVLPRLERHGGTDVRRSTLRRGTPIATVRDPDGVLVELLHVPPGATHRP